MADQSTMKDDLIDILSKDTSVILNQDDKKMQKAASLFLNQWEQFSSYLQQAEELNQQQEKVKNRVRNFSFVKDNKKTASQLKALYSKYGGEKYSQRQKRISEILKNHAPTFFKSAEQFQKILNEVLGQQIIYTFIFQNDEGLPVIFQLNSPLQLISGYQFNKDKNLVARFKSRSQSLIKKISSFSQIIPERENNDIDALNKTYDSVMFRWGIAKKRKTYYIMWKPKDHWLKMKIGTSGDLQEAYGAIIFTNRGVAANFNVPSLQQAVDLYMQFVKGVDNVWGGLQGDLAKNAMDQLDRTIDGKDRAIKSFNAQEMSIMPFITIAKLIRDGIIKSSNLEKVRQYFDSIGETRNIVERVQDGAEKEIEQIIMNQTNRVKWGTQIKIL